MHPCPQFFDLVVGDPELPNRRLERRQPTVVARVELLSGGFPLCVEVLRDLILLPLPLGVVRLPVRDAFREERGQLVTMAFDQRSANVPRPIAGGVPFV